jgi:hypothetical protein
MVFLIVFTDLSLWGGIEVPLYRGAGLSTSDGWVSIDNESDQAS